MIALDLNDYDHVAFDLDGVLVNSEAVIESALRRWAMEAQLSPDDVVRMSAARRDVDLVAAIAPDLSPEHEAARIASYEIQAMQLLQPIQGAATFYRSIPYARRSIVTSSARISALVRLERVGIPCPNILIAAEDVTRGKPHPQPYQTLLHRLRLSPQRCLVFEDSSTGIEAATAAGCDCIGVGAEVRDHPDTKGWVNDFRELALPGQLRTTCSPSLKRSTT